MPPQYSPFAFWRSTPSIVVFVAIGNSSVVFAAWSSSTAVAVIILKVEPGGWGAENAMPGETAHLARRGRPRAAIPPKRPARACTAAACTSVSIVVRTGAAGRGWELASTWSPASSWPPGVPATSFSTARSRPESPTGVLAGKPRASSDWRSAAVSAWPTVPAIDAPTPPAGELRALPGPDTSVCPSRERIGARSGARVSRRSSAPRGMPGNDMLRAQPTRPSFVRSRRSARTVPKMRVFTIIGTLTMPAPTSFGLPAVIRVAVAIVRARTYAAANVAGLTRACDSGVSSPYIAA